MYTLTDEVVLPNFGPVASSALHGGRGAITNVAIQTVCPTDPTEHIGIYDHAAYALAVDAAVATTLATYPHVPAEPRLAGYVTAGSRAAAARRSP